MTEGLAGKVVTKECRLQDNMYLLHTGNPAICGNDCAGVRRACPWYPQLEEMGLVAISCNGEKPLVELSAEARSHLYLAYEKDPLRTRDVHFVIIARWRLLGIRTITNKTITRQFIKDSTGADVVYRWKWEPTVIGRRFMKQGWPGPPLMNSFQVHREPLDTPIESEVELQRYDGSWGRSMPKSWGRGGIYVQ